MQLHNICRVVYSLHCHRTPRRRHARTTIHRRHSDDIACTCGGWLSDILTLSTDRRPCSDSHNESDTQCRCQSLPCLNTHGIVIRHNVPDSTQTLWQKTCCVPDAEATKNQFFVHSISWEVFKKKIHDVRSKDAHPTISKEP